MRVKKLIIFQNVSKQINNIPILHNINLSIENSDIFGIIGYSGAGKSTLLRLINALDVFQQGKILVDNNVINKLNGYDLRLLRQKIGMIFQNFNLLSSRNVFDNIALPLEIAGWSKTDINNRVNELISLVDLEEKKGFYPKDLSGGQKQRVGIARALANNPTILLCDEATSALDPANTNAILKLLQNIQQQLNITIVIITHQMNVIKSICNKVAVMDKGYIVEQGKVEEIFTNPQHKITQLLLNN